MERSLTWMELIDGKQVNDTFTSARTEELGLGRVKLNRDLEVDTHKSVYSIESDV